MDGSPLARPAGLWRWAGRPPEAPQGRGLVFVSGASTLPCALTVVDERSASAAGTRRLGRHSPAAPLSPRAAGLRGPFPHCAQGLYNQALRVAPGWSRARGVPDAIARRARNGPPPQAGGLDGLSPSRSRRRGPSEGKNAMAAPEALQASECRELLSNARASLSIVAQHWRCKPLSLSVMLYSFLSLCQCYLSLSAA